MNKKDVVKKVSEKSGVDIETCKKVIDAFEKVLNDGLMNKIQFWKRGSSNYSKKMIE